MRVPVLLVGVLHLKRAIALLLLLVIVLVLVLKFALVLAVFM
jgi:hypothetical protein